MPRNKFTIPVSSYDNKSLVQEWFLSHGFQKAEFKKKKIYLEHEWSDNNIIYYSLIENPGYVTFYKYGPWESLFVIEIKHNESQIFCESYSPILIFGFIRKEYAFIKNPPKLKYWLQEGHNYITEFQKHFNRLEPHHTI